MAQKLWNWQNTELANFRVFFLPNAVFSYPIFWILHRASSVAYLASFPHISWKFVSRPSVRPPGQLKEPYLLSFCCYSMWRIHMKLPGYHKTVSTYQTYIPYFGFWYGLRQGQFCDPIKRNRDDANSLLYASDPLNLLWMSLCWTIVDGLSANVERWPS